MPPTVNAADSPFRLPFEERRPLKQQKTWKIPLVRTTMRAEHKQGRALTRNVSTNVPGLLAPSPTTTRTDVTLDMIPKHLPALPTNCPHHQARVRRIPSSKFVVPTTSDAFVQAGETTKREGGGGASTTQDAPSYRAAQEIDMFTVFDFSFHLKRQFVASVTLVSMNELTPSKSDYATDVHRLKNDDTVSRCDCDAGDNYENEFWLKRYLTCGTHQVLEVWPLCRQAALAARPSCEQVLLRHGSLALGCSRVPFSQNSCSREKRFGH